MDTDHEEDIDKDPVAITNRQMKIDIMAYGANAADKGLDYYCGANHLHPRQCGPDRRHAAERTFMSCMHPREEGHREPGLRGEAQRDCAQAQVATSKIRARGAEPDRELPPTAISREALQFADFARLRLCFCGRRSVL